MTEVPDWKVSKWPFLLGNVVLLAVAAAIIYTAHHPISQTEEILACAVVALGAILGCIPFYLDYCATGRLMEVNGMTTVMEQLNDLKKYSAQIATATDQWARVQEVTKGHSDKTIAAASEISERMATEIKEFNEFQGKLNDMEKGALKLEIEKFRRTEGEWVQVVARILDHVFALYTAAVRSGQPELAEQIAHFQTTCRDAARRVGLVPFGLEPNDKFDSKKHRAQGVENPAEGTALSGLLAPGITYQGRLIRMALVRLAGDPEPVAEEVVVKEPVAEKTGPAEPDQLTLEAD